MIKLFTYGTLQNEEVQENLFKRVLKGTPEKLNGFALKNIHLEEEFGVVQYPIIVETKNEGDFIDGIVYEISEYELGQADLYEGIHYRRIEVELSSQNKAWAYSAAD